MKKKGRCKLSVKLKKSMLQMSNRRFRGKPQRSLSVINRHLSKRHWGQAPTQLKFKAINYESGVKII